MRNRKPHNYIDLAGRTFGRLMVLEETESVSRGKATESYWRCRCICGNEKLVKGYNLRNGDSKSCGCLRTDMLHNRNGQHHPSWKGGRRQTPDGYIILYNPDFPGLGINGQRTSNGSTSVYEHVVVMSRHLGRPLFPHETVHHKNGIRDDNRLENLELWTSSHPSGQRVEDVIAWAKSTLTAYEGLASKVRNDKECAAVLHSKMNQ